MKKGKCRIVHNSEETVMRKNGCIRYTLNLSITGSRFLISPLVLSVVVFFVHTLIG